MKLRKWQRLAVVVSIAWMIAAPLSLTSKENDAAVADAANMYSTCSGGPYPVNADTCDKLRDQVLANHQRFDGHLAGNGVLAASLLAAAWLAVWLLLVVSRWILRGA